MFPNLEQEPAFILHARPFQETALLLDVFTLHQGRMGVMARGVRQSKSKRVGLLQAFIPLSITTVGRATLKTLKQVESRDRPFFFTGVRLYSALYVNELLYKILPQHDPDEVIFHEYQQTLFDLMAMPPEIILRRFELRLLRRLGFGQNFQQDTEERALESTTFYEWIVDRGWQVSNSKGIEKGYCGAHLLSIGLEEFDDPEVLKTAKRVTRQMLQSLLTKPIEARMLFHAS